MTNTTIAPYAGGPDEPLFAFQAREAAIEQKKRRLKDLMAQYAAQAGIQTDNGRMVSGHYVAPSWAQGLAANVVQPMELQKAIRELETGIQQDTSQYEQADRRRAIEHAMSRPQATPELAGPADPNNPAELQARTPTPNDTIAWAEKGMGIPSRRGMLEKLVSDQMINEPVRQEARDFRASEAEANRQARAAEAEAARIERGEQLAADRVERERQDKLRSEDKAADREARSADRRATIEGAMRAAEIRAGASGGAAKPNEKPLTSTELAKVQKQAGTVADAERFVDTFKDEYAGPTAGIERLSGSYNPLAGQNSKDMSAWWNDYQARKNAVRHELFGSALTATEKGEWEKSDVSPTMQPDQIKKNLNRRAQLERQAYEKLDAALRSGTRSGQLEAVKPTGAIPRVKSVAEAMKLPPGTVFVDPNGVQRTR